MPIDTGVPLLQDTPTVRCVHQMVTHAHSVDPVIIAPYDFCHLAVKFPAVSVTADMETRDFEVTAATELRKLGLELPDGVTKICQQEDVDNKRLNLPKSMLEVYNPTSETIVLPPDSFIARLSPIHTCSGKHCAEPPEYTHGSYVDPYYRFDDTGPMDFQTTGTDDVHHYQLELQAMESQLSEMDVDRHDLQKQFQSQLLPPTPAPLSDEDFLAKFPPLNDLSETEAEKFRQLLLKNRHRNNCWSDNDWDIGDVKHRPHSIAVNGHAPIKMRPYRMPPVRQKLLHKFLTELVQAGVLEEGLSPWGFPLLLQKKPGRDPALPQSYRLLCDFRRLNSIVSMPSVALPRIDELIRDLAVGNSWFSTQDLTQGFYAVRLDKESSRICTIVSPTGLSYQFKRLPQGLRSSPNFFSQMMCSAFQQLTDHSKVYIDDLITATKTFEEMCTALEEGWMKLYEMGLKLKPEKCVYARNSIDVLGWHIDAEGKRPQRKKMDSLRKLAVPATYKDLQCAVGLLNYYRNHLLRYSDRAHPILKLLRGERGKKFVFPPDATEAWKRLTGELADGFALNHPSANGQLRIYTDASDVALGGVLVEYPPGADMDPTTSNPTEFPQGKVLAFCSHTLTAAEKNYTISDRELLAVVYAVEKFHTFLNRRFQVVTDHKALEWYQSIKSNRNKRLQRYAMFLSQYCMDLLYRSGPLNVVADAISRLYIVKHTATPSPSAAAPHPAQSFMLNTATYTHIGEPIPLTRARAIVGQTVAIRTDSFDHFRARFKVPELTIRHRYGYIVKVLPHSKQVRIHFAHGSELTIPWTRVQHIPFADYAAALSLHPEKIVTAQRSLPFLLSEAQKQDSELKTLFPDAAASEGLRKHVMKRWKLTDAVISVNAAGLLCATVGEKPLLLIPREQRQRYMSLAHNSICEGGHRAAGATKNIITNLAYWPGLVSDVVKFCKTCHYCQIHARHRLPKSLPAGSLDVSYPFQRIAVDFLGPYNTTEDGNRYILVVIDHFTKYAMAFPLPNRASETVARCLFDRVFCVFGFPESVLTDGAAELLDKSLTALYRSLGIEHLIATAYHARGNSVVERLNGTLKGMLKKFKSATGRDWDLLVASITFAYNGAVNRSTGFSPYFLMFARDFRSPLALAHGVDTPLANTIEDYVKAMLDALRVAHAAIHDKLFAKEAALAMKNDRIVADNPTVLYNVGDLVTWKRQAKDKAADQLTATWTGPWRVVDRWGAGVYKIELPSKSGGEYRLAPAYQLQRYHSRPEVFPEVVEPDYIAPTAAADHDAPLVVGGAQIVGSRDPAVAAVAPPTSLVVNQVEKPLPTAAVDVSITAPPAGSNAKSTALSGMMFPPPASHAAAALH